MEAAEEDRIAIMMEEEARIEISRRFQAICSEHDQAEMLDDLDGRYPF